MNALFCQQEVVLVKTLVNLSDKNFDNCVKINSYVSVVSKW